MSLYNRYWVPSRKWELEDWLESQFPDKPKSVWVKKSKKELYAIYHSIRREMGR